MKHFVGTLLLATCLSWSPHVSVAAEPVPAVVLPDFPAPIPSPKPNPATPQKLSKDELFVVRAEVEIIVLISPDSGLVKITEEAGPLRIRGLFVGGAGKTETRTFKEKFLFLLEANGVGRVEVIVIVGKEIIRRSLDVDNGSPTPIPPGPTPVPPDPPTPVPPNPAPIPVAGFRVLIFYESAELAKMPPKQALILTGKETRDYLNAKCVQEGNMRGYWIIDKDADLSGLAKHWQEAGKRKRDAVPWMILSNGKTGWEGPLPTTVEEFLTLCKKYEVAP